MIMPQIGKVAAVIIALVAGDISWMANSNRLAAHLGMLPMMKADGDKER